jgi:hypothetical protein
MTTYAALPSFTVTWGTESFGPIPAIQDKYLSNLVG